MTISILERNKNYITVKIPRRMWSKFDFIEKNQLTENEALKILRAGMQESKKGKTRKLASLRELRYGN